MSEEHRHPKREVGYAALTVMVLGTVMGGLLQNAVSTVLPAIMVETDVTVGVAQWLVTVFQLCLGIIVPLVAFLVRRFNVRDLFAFSMALFAAGTYLVAVAPSFEFLFAGRVLEGVGAGIGFPLVQVVVFRNFPRNRWGTIMGVIGLAFGFAPNVGPTVAGIFADLWGWRSLFWAVAVACTIITALMLALIPKQMAATDERVLDWPSVALSTIGFGGVLMGFANASDAGFASIQCLVPLVVGTLGLVVFVHRQRSISNPLLDLDSFLDRNFTVGTIMVCLLFAAFIGVTLVLPVGLQQVHGYDALHAGLALLPGTIAALLMNPLSGVLLDKYGPRFIICLGGVLLVVGTIPLMWLSAIDELWMVMLFQGIRTFGISSLIQPISTWSVRSLAPNLIPDGTSISNAVRQVAAALGTSVMVMLMSLGALAGEVTAFGVDAAMVFSAACSAVLCILGFVFVKR